MYHTQYTAHSYMYTYIYTIIILYVCTLPAYSILNVLMAVAFALYTQKINRIQLYCFYTVLCIRCVCIPDVSDCTC